MAPNKKKSPSDTKTRSHKKRDRIDDSTPTRGPGRPPVEESPPGKSERPQKLQRSIASVARNFFCSIKSWIPQLAIRSGEVINFQTCRILLLTMISTAISTPLTWVDSAPIMAPVFKRVHELTKVSVSFLKNLFDKTDMEDGDDDGERVLSVPVAERSTETPTVRFDLRGCTPRHLQAINDFIDACHSKAGAGKVSVPLSPHLSLTP